MKEEEFGPIEQEIVKEENPQEAAEPSKPVPKKEPAQISKVATNIFKGLKRPKIVTLVILLGLGVLVFLSLNLLMVKQQEREQEPGLPQTQISPSPSTDPSLANIAQRVETYGKKIDTLDNFKKKLAKPIVDLEIDFEEE